MAPSAPLGSRRDDRVLRSGFMATALLAAPWLLSVALYAGSMLLASAWLFVASFWAVLAAGPMAMLAAPLTVMAVRRRAPWLRPACLISLVNVLLLLPFLAFASLQMELWGR
ncbi:hypothetical protein [Aquipuribacter nitratireducens]|uniref:Uncharacterized protein n=1 Tax=Aquipuribacter nitratireducens TaxID=650104 RepID=A0ABW0GLK8_9MICO